MARRGAKLSEDFTAENKSYMRYRREEYLCDTSASPVLSARLNDVSRAGLGLTNLNHEVSPSRTLAPSCLSGKIPARSGNFLLSPIAIGVNSHLSFSFSILLTYEKNIYRWFVLPFMFCG